MKLRVASQSTKPGQVEEEPIIVTERYKRLDAILDNEVLRRALLKLPTSQELEAVSFPSRKWRAAEAH